MPVIHLNATAGADGVLHLAIPAESGDYDVKVELTAKRGTNPSGGLAPYYGCIQDENFVAPPRDAATSEQHGWPVGYYEAVVGSVTDDSFVLPERRSIKPIPPLDAE